jgi:outer membrane lipoprotein SlyB
MELSHERPSQPYGLLYPMMVIAAIAVIVFSILGIASIAGWMPSALSAASVAQPQATGEADVPVAVRAGPAFECAECGMIESIREIERRGAASDLVRVQAART